MRLTNSARQEAGLFLDFQNIQTVPLCWNGAESLLAVAAGSRGHVTASPARAHSTAPNWRYEV
eukprot:COSAG01_NODE_17271_length_1164_cov_4.917371_1_plen_63_part_00